MSYEHSGVRQVIETQRGQQSSQKQQDRCGVASKRGLTKGHKMLLTLYVAKNCDRFVIRYFGKFVKMSFDQPDKVKGLVLGVDAEMNNLHTNFQFSRWSLNFLSSVIYSCSAYLPFEFETMKNR